jgi:hypothetical protein
MQLKIAAAALAALTLTAGAARAADFVTVPLEATINAPADKAWPKINGYCLIGAWFKTTCTVAGPDGQVGSVRTIAGRIEELLVAKTAWSYTYSQPKSPIDYHGTVEIQPIDKGHSKLLYTLVYRQGRRQGQPHQAVHRSGRDHEGRRRSQIGRTSDARGT